MPRKLKVTSPDGRSFVVTAPDDATDEQIIEYAKANMPVEEAAPASEAPMDKPSLLSLAGKAARQTAEGIGSLGDLGMSVLQGAIPGDPYHQATPAIEGVTNLVKGAGAMASGASKKLWDAVRGVAASDESPATLLRPAVEAGTLGLATQPIANVEEGYKERGIPGAVASGVGEAAMLLGPAAASKVAGKVPLRPGSLVGAPANFLDSYLQRKGYSAFTPQIAADYESEIARALKSGELNLKQASQLRKEAGSRAPLSTTPLPLTVSERAAPNSPGQLRARTIERSVGASSGAAKRFRSEQAIEADNMRQALLGRVSGPAGPMDLDVAQQELTQIFRKTASTQLDNAWGKMESALDAADAQLGRPSVPIIGVKGSVLADIGEDFASTGGLSEPIGGVADQTLASVAAKLKQQAEFRGSATLTLREAHALSKELRSRVPNRTWAGTVSATPQEAQYIRYAKMLDNSIDSSLSTASPEARKAFAAGKKAYSDTKKWRERTYIRQVINSKNTQDMAAVLMKGTAPDIRDVLSQLPKKYRNPARGMVLEDILNRATTSQEGINKLSGSLLKAEVEKRLSGGRLDALLTPLERAEFKQFVDSVGRIEASTASGDVGRATAGVSTQSVGMGVGGFLLGGPYGLAAGAIGGPLLTNRVLAHLMFQPGGGKALRGTLDVMKRVGATELTPELLQQMQKGAYGGMVARYSKTVQNAMGEAEGQPEVEGGEEDMLAFLNPVD